MKRYAKILLVFGSLCLVSFVGCKTTKNMERNERTEQSAKQVKLAIDKSITAKEAGSKISIETNQDIREFNRTTHFDSTGNISSVSETWREVGRSELAVLNDSSRTVFMSDKNDSTSFIDKSETQFQQKEVASADSRPVQGIEWMWVIFGVGLIAAVLIIVFIRKLK